MDLIESEGGKIDRKSKGRGELSQTIRNDLSRYIKIPLDKVILPANFTPGRNDA